jgi:hypothetical protein
MKNIFVGDFGATESSVRALFEPHGKVERVNLVSGRDTGCARGFAFVEMTDSAEAGRAIAALNGTNFSGRQWKSKSCSRAAETLSKRTGCTCLRARAAQISILFHGWA